MPLEEGPIRRLLRERREKTRVGTQISDHRKEQIRALLEQHIPPLEKEFAENAAFYRRRLPPEHEIADFYEKLLTHIYDLKRKYEAELVK
jgi:GTP1/Obg family GTP-binding protein